MFSIRRTLDNFIMKRSNRRAVVAAEYARVEALEKIFAIKLPVMQTAFMNAPADFFDGTLPEYPPALYLNEIGVDAFVTNMAIEDSLLEKFFDIAASDMVEVESMHYMSKGDAHKICHTFVATKSEFQGHTVYVLTNDMNLLRRLGDDDLNPPPPWSLFPKLGLPVGDMQGDAQYWYENHWYPYWRHLSPDQRTKFLRDRNPGPDWEECLRWREPKQQQNKVTA